MPQDRIHQGVILQGSQVLLMGHPTLETVEPYEPGQTVPHIP